SLGRYCTIRGYQVSISGFSFSAQSFSSGASVVSMVYSNLTPVDRASCALAACGESHMPIVASRPAVAQHKLLIRPSISILVVFRIVAEVSKVSDLESESILTHFAGGVHPQITQMCAD